MKRLPNQTKKPAISEKFWDITEAATRGALTAEPEAHGADAGGAHVAPSQIIQMSDGDDAARRYAHDGRR